VRDGMEPSSGADPDHLPYEGKVTAVCDGLAREPGLEPGLSWARTRRVAGLHHSPSLIAFHHARVVRRPRIELGTFRVRACCSAS
jgi:hypothetical protein